MAQPPEWEAILKKLIPPPGPISVYEAVFQAREADLQQVRREFILRFGSDAFEKYIAPYFSTERPGYLWAAPTTPFKYWLVDRLARNRSARTGREYDIPPSFLAVDIPDDLEFSTCARCGCLIEIGLAMSGERFGLGLVCLPCHANLSLAEITRLSSRTENQK